MIGIKKHTHAEREVVIKKMIPLIKKKLGSNLIALASSASFARNEDIDYSDLELVAFVKRMPSGKIRGMGKICDGMLVELLWMTKKEFIKYTPDVNKYWFVSGSDRLVPIINKPYIYELNNYKIRNLKKKCFKEAVNSWNECQENTAKTLNAILQKNIDGIGITIFYTYMDMLKVLSFLNQTPYVTLSRFATQSRTFKLKPKHFDELTDIVVNGLYLDLPRLKKVLENVFTEFEIIFADLGLSLYYDNVDPNKSEAKRIPLKIN